MHSLLVKPGFTFVREAPEAVHAWVTRWLTRKGAAEGQPLSFPTTEHGRADPLLKVLFDVSVEDTNATLFTTDGRFVARGGGDGSLMVCDLSEVNRQLSAVGMG